MEIKDPVLAEKIAEWREAHKIDKSKPQRRVVEMDPDMEIRMDFDNPKIPKIVGYAAVFNKRAEIWPGFFEQVMPGAFTKTIGKDDVRALWNHNPDYVLGRTKSGTLELREDDKGLRYEIRPPDTTWARDLQTLIKRKDVSQSSFGFNIIKESFTKEKEGKDVVRSLEEVKLFDVSPVTFPAYKQTEVHVRMIEGEKEMAYLFEETGEVVVQPICADVQDAAVRSESEEDFIKRISGFKPKY